MGLVFDDNEVDGYIKKEETNNNAGAGNAERDPRFVKLEIGGKYRFRLLWWDETGRRKSPFVKVYRHHYKLVDENGKDKWASTVCPSTNLEGKEGWNACKCCKRAKEHYQKFEKQGSKSDKAMYDQIKKSFTGYAVVLVLSDSVTPENKGTVKLLKFRTKAMDFFNKEIFGIEKKFGKKDDAKSEEGEEDDGDCVRMQAFKLKNGYDLLLDITTPDSKWPAYEFKFARRATDLDFSAKEIEEQCKAMKFDELSAHYDLAKIDEFMHVLDGGELPASSSAQAVNEDDEEVATKPKPKATPKAEPKVEAKAEPKAETKSKPAPAKSIADADADELDDLLSSLE